MLLEQRHLCKCKVLSFFCDYPHTPLSELYHWSANLIFDFVSKPPHIKKASFCRFGHFQLFSGQFDGLQSNKSKPL